MADYTTAFAFAAAFYVDNTDSLIYT